MKRIKSSKWSQATGVEEIIAHSELFVEPKLRDICAFLSGYDAALGGAPLLGLHQWLILKKSMKDGDDVHWSQNLKTLAWRRTGGSASPARLVDEARAVLAEFFSYRRRYGVKKLYAEYIRRRGRKLRQEGI